MHSSILIDTTGGQETRILVLEGGKVQEFKRETKSSNRLAGNIYLARIDKIEPSIQAAFVDIGIDKHGFLPFRAIHPDYYNIDPYKKEIKPPDPNLENTDAAEQPGSDLLSEFDDYATDFGVITRNHVFGREKNKHQLNGSRVRKKQRNHRTSPRNIANDYLIQDVLSKGQVVLVQVTRDEINSKGATLTTYISLPSRYCVLLPNSDKGFSISSKIGSPDTRKELRQIFENFDFPQGAGLIMRTINSIPPGEVIEADIRRQIGTWNDILDKINHSKAPALIKPSSDIIETTIRDHFRDSIDEIIVAGDEGYEKTIKVVDDLVPHEAEKVIKHTYLKPLFVHHGVHEDLRNLHDPRVELASGGHLVIQPTEALVAIDVNSAKSNQGKTLTETALKTNIEAAREIARQLRLRDLAGIIVIDFIDMDNQAHRKEVEIALRSALRRDQAWINCGYISKLGLLEMTRQRAGENLASNTTKLCPACGGTGRVVLDETLAVIILRHIEAECSLRKAGNVQVSVSSSLENYFLNETRRDISRIEDIYGCRIRFETKESLFSQEYSFVLFSPDRNKEIFRYPPKHPTHVSNSPKSTWSSKNGYRHSSKSEGKNRRSRAEKETNEPSKPQDANDLKQKADKSPNSTQIKQEKRQAVSSAANRKQKSATKKVESSVATDQKIQNNTQEKETKTKVEGKASKSKTKRVKVKMSSSKKKPVQSTKKDSPENLKQDKEPEHRSETKEKEIVTADAKNITSQEQAAPASESSAVPKKEGSTLKKKTPGKPPVKKKQQRLRQVKAQSMNPEFQNLMNEIAPENYSQKERKLAFDVDLVSPNDLDIFFDSDD